MNKSTDTSKKVMNRIMSEDKWTVPVHKQQKRNSGRFHSFSLIISILLLVGISVSFIFINPPTPKDALEPKPIKDEVRIDAAIKTTDFAKIYSNLDFISIKEGAVDSIGVPKIYQPRKKGINTNQLFWMLSILGVALITLFMSWFSRENTKK